MATVTGAALVLFGREYRDLPPLVSANASAQQIRAALMSESPGLPLWSSWRTGADEIPVIEIGETEQQLKPVLADFATGADRAGVNTVFLFAAGHGYAHGDNA